MSFFDAFLEVILYYAICRWTHTARSGVTTPSSDRGRTTETFPSRHRFALCRDSGWLLKHDDTMETDLLGDVGMSNQTVGCSQRTHSQRTLSQRR